MKFRLFRRDRRVRDLFEKAEKMRKYLRVVRAGQVSIIKEPLGSETEIDCLLTGIVLPSVEKAVFTLRNKQIAVRALSYCRRDNTRTRIINLCNYNYQPHSPNRRYKYSRFSFKYLYEGDRYRKGMNNYNVFPGLKRKV